METVVERQDTTPRALELSRREILLGGLCLGGVLLTGCGSQNAGLPGPRYPFEGGTGPELVRNVPATLPAAPTPAPAPPIELPTGILSRTQWTRSAMARPREANEMAGISRITVHHDAIVSTDLRSGTDVARRIESIRRSHVQKGWADIGYHYVIDPHGRVWEGRPLFKQGAHVEHNNEHNLGIVVLGNFDVHPPTTAATLTVERFVASQMHRYRVPMSRVYTHQELKSTACPGSRLQRFMRMTRASGGGLMALAT
jgi:hypothetical protein